MMPSVDVLIQQAQIAEREGRRDDARSLYERALYSLKRAQDGKTASSLLRWIGRTYYLDANAEHVTLQRQQTRRVGVESRTVRTIGGDVEERQP